MNAPLATDRARLVAVGAIVINSFVWGVSWWPFRQLDAIGLHSLWTTAFVYLLAFAAIHLWRPGAWRELWTRPSLWWLLLASGVTNAAFNWGVIVGEVVRVVLLFYLMPVWAVPLARWFNGERVTRSALVRIAIALAGAWLVLWEPGLGAPVPNSLGDWLGLIGGVSFAFTTVLLRRFADAPEEGRAAAMFGGGAVVSALAGMLMSGSGVVDWPPALATGWAAGVVALTLAFLIANLALQFGAAQLPSGVTTIVLLSEVVFAAASAIWLGGETLAPRVALGGALICGAALLAARGPRAQD